MIRPASIFADATAGASASAAVVAGLTLNEWAAAVAIAAGLFSIYDRWNARRIKCHACRSLARESLPE